MASIRVFKVYTDLLNRQVWPTTGHTPGDGLTQHDALTFLELRSTLLHFDARHTDTCPQKQQAYWRLRPEYRPADFVGEQPCTCGLDAFLGKHDDRKQS